MPTIKKRINISISSDLDKALSAVARRDHVPEATKAAELLRLGLEVEEDILLEYVATERLRTAKKFLSHKEVWGK